MVRAQLTCGDGLVVLACIIAAGCIVILLALAALIVLGVRWGKL